MDQQQHSGYARLKHPAQQLRLVVWQRQRRGVSPLSARVFRVAQDQDREPAPGGERHRGGLLLLVRHRIDIRADRGPLQSQQRRVGPLDGLSDRDDARLARLQAEAARDKSGLKLMLLGGMGEPGAPGTWTGKKEPTDTDTEEALVFWTSIELMARCGGGVVGNMRSAVSRLAFGAACASRPAGSTCYARSFEGCG